MRHGMALKIDNKGFSLVELIIVIAMIAVLVGIVAPQFIKYVEQSREANDLDTVEEIKKAVEAYSSEHEQRGVHVVEADGHNITYTLGDGGSLLEYGVQSSVVQCSSEKIAFRWEYRDFAWSLISDDCLANGAFYNASGEKVRN